MARKVTRKSHPWRNSDPLMIIPYNFLGYVKCLFAHLYAHSATRCVLDRAQQAAVDAVLERTLLNYHRFGQCFVLDGSKLLESVIYISSERTVPRCAELDHG